MGCQASRADDPRASSIPPHPSGVIVLAGGRAARLGGADKPGLVVGTRTLIGSVVSAGAAAGARRIVVVGPHRAGLAAESLAGARQETDLRFVREDPPGGGPVPALRRGLAEIGGRSAAGGPGAAGARAATGGPWVAVLAADLPFLRAAHLAALAGAAAGHAGAVLADDTGHPQWLAGCWRADVLSGAIAGYTGASLRGLLAPLQPVTVTITPQAGEPPPWLDCDTPEDVRRARDWHARGGHHPGTAAG